MASQYNENNITNQDTLARKRELGEIAVVADLTNKNLLKMQELLKAKETYNKLRNRNSEDLIKINQEIKPDISTIIEKFINFKSQSNISSDETKTIDLIYTNVKTLLTFKLIDFKIKEKRDLFDIILKNLKSLELKIDVVNLSELISTLEMLCKKIIIEYYYSEKLKNKHNQLRIELRQSFKLNGGGNPSMNNITEKNSLYTKAEALLLELNIKDKNKYYNGTYKDSGKLVTSYRENDLILYSPENIQNLITVIETSYNKKSLLKKKVVSSNKPKLIKILKSINELKLQEKSLNNTNFTDAQLELELELAELDSNSNTNKLTAAELAQLAELDSNSNTNKLTAAELAQLEEEAKAEMEAKREAAAAKRAKKLNIKKSRTSTAGGSLKKTKKVKKSNKKSKTLKK